MAFLSGFALVMLTLVGYASGMNLAGRYKGVQPHFSDLLIISILWFGAFRFRETLGEWFSLFVWLGIALLVAWLLTSLRLRDAPAAIPESELPEHAREQAVPNRHPFRRVWDGWVGFSHGMGNLQGRLLMGFFYFIVISPFGLVIAFLQDNLQVKQAPNGSGWSDKEALDETLEGAHTQG